MTDKILTDEEKSALLKGVQSGEVEIHSSAGSAYATVTPFEIGVRARITKDGYPRLQLLHQQFADKLSKYTGDLLQCDFSFAPRGVSVRSFGEYCEQLAGPAVVTIFEAKPLMGQALVVLEPAMVRHLVATFFGGGEDCSTLQSDSSFTPGELSISTLFTKTVLSTIAEVWGSLIEISPDRIANEESIDVIDIVAESDSVIGSSFEISSIDREGLLHILWPVEMVQPLVPAFNGRRTDRDADEDARWEVAIRRQLANAVVNLTSNVGQAKMNLRHLVNLRPGDVIGIDGPQEATVLANHVPLLRGRFGVHRGRNAVESIDWLPQPSN